MGESVDIGETRQGPRKFITTSPYHMMRRTFVAGRLLIGSGCARAEPEGVITALSALDDFGPGNSES